MEPFEQRQRIIPPQNTTDTSAGGNVLLFIWDLVKIIVIAMAIIIPIHEAVAQPFIVSGSSMEPNFHSGEYLIIDELSYHFNEPQRGDVVVFRYPKDNRQYFIKRVIGLPGERLRIENNQVVIFNQEHPQGWTLDEEYLLADNITYPATENETIILGSDQYFVLGDNRLASSDSRFWGPVPRKDIVGKAFIRAFPFQNFEKFQSVIYQD